MPGPSGVARQSRPRKRAEKPLDDIDEEILKQLPDDIRKEIEAERKAKVRERRGNSKVPSYKDLYSTSQYVQTDKLMLATSFSG